MLPVVTIIGLQLGGLLARRRADRDDLQPGRRRASAVTEAIQRRDYAVVQGFVLVIAVGYLFVNLIVDISYA